MANNDRSSDRTSLEIFLESITTGSGLGAAVVVVGFVFYKLGLGYGFACIVLYTVMVYIVYALVGRKYKK